METGNTPNRGGARKANTMSASTSFEIGVVYKKNGRHFLAVSNKTLITFAKGEMQEVRPYAKYEVVRSISVDELCQQWGVPLDQLDKVTASFLAPATEGLKTRPRGSRRRKVADEFAWRNLRLTRLSRAG